jgi:hypothetical protein
VSVLAKQGTALLALAEADDALARFSDFGELSLLAGSIATGQGLLDKASRYFLHARDQGLPDGLVGLRNLVVLYTEKGDEPAAARLTRTIAAAR